MFAEVVMKRTAYCAVVLVVLALSGTGCQWREGDTYMISYRDASPNSDADDDGCENQPGQVESVDGIYSIIYGQEPFRLIDVRLLADCENGRIPGAECNPWNGESLLNSLDDLEDEPGWLVFYDWNGVLMEEVNSTLPYFCHREVVWLEGGFGAWSTTDHEIETGEAE